MTAIDPTGLSTIPACLRSAAVDAPDVEAIVDGEVRLTFAQLDAEVTRFARAAVARGLQPGDRAIVWAPNSARWVVSALGIMAAGGILVPINTRFKGEEARYAIEKVRAAMVVLDDSFLGNGYLQMLRGDSADAAAGPSRPTAERPVPAVPHVHTVVLLDAAPAKAAADIGTGAAAEAEPALSYEQFLAGAAETPVGEIDARIDALSPDDVADILFTSGTTGYPKGAMVTHRSNLLVDLAWSDMTGLLRADRYLLINPFFHSFGYRAGVLACLIRRATMLPMATFDVPATLRLIETERVTVFPGAPTVYTSLLDHPDFADHDLSSVRLAVTGATVVPVPLLHRMRDELGFRDVITAYGLTETCGTATVCPPDTDEHRISTSCGIAIPGTEVRIVGSDGIEVPVEQIGEVHVRGYNVMLGYFEDEAATAAAVDTDGWMHTGDVGWMDADGYLRITDRIKDVVMVGGFNVYPAEVERIIREHPAVSDVAVVGEPDERLGEVTSAYVQLRAGAVVTEGELLEFCRGKMANFKQPRRIAFITELPRTPSGKIQKFKLATDS